VDKQLSNVTAAGPQKVQFAGIAPGQAKYTFLYVVGSAIAMTAAIVYSLMAGLVWWHALLVFGGCLLAAWVIVFAFLDVRGSGQNATKNEALQEGPDPYASRTLEVAPPTGEAYPHHEDYVESQGFDQGQLTARIPGSTPFFDSFLERREKQKARR